MTSLNHLLERTREAEDLDAFGEVVTRFHGMAFRTAYSVTGDVHSAHDAAQEAFVKAYASLDRLEDLARFPSWFRRIVLRTATDVLRRRSREQPTPPDSEVFATTPTTDAAPNEVADAKALRQTVLACLRSLSYANRLATTLFYMEGLSIAEIANLLLSPSGTVKRRLHDSRKQLAREERLKEICRAGLHPYSWSQERDTMRYNQEITFCTAEEAPAQFDAWSFSWRAPRLTKGAELEYAVLGPDGTELARAGLFGFRRGKSMRVDFGGEGGARAVTPFRGRHVTFVMRVRKGHVMFPSSAAFTFTFYRQDAEGRIDWNKPFSTIPALADLDEALAVEADDRAVSPERAISHEVTFRSERPAPASFDEWQFCCPQPRVADEADLDYILAEPEEAGAPRCERTGVRCGHIDGLTLDEHFGGCCDPSVFRNRHLAVKLRVTHGQMQFVKAPGPSFRFYRVTEDGKRRLVDEISALPHPAQELTFFEPHTDVKMVNSDEIDCGVVYCGHDDETGESDIFVADPELGHRLNLTTGRVASPDWSQPWEPIASPDGETVVFRQFRRRSDNGIETRIWLLDVDTRELRQIPELFGFACSFTWAPDSRSVAFGMDRSEIRYGEIAPRVIAIDRETLTTRVIVHVGEVRGSSTSPVWSPDGKWIAVGSAGEGGRLRLVSPAGTTRGADITGPERGRVRWSPDGQRLGAVIDRRLCVLGLDGGIREQFGPAFLVYGWSADGAYIAYSTRDAQINHVMILPTDGGDVRQVTFEGDAVFATWAPDSNRLAFWALPARDPYLLMVVGPDGQDPRSFAQAHGCGFMYPSWLKRGYASRKT